MTNSFESLSPISGLPSKRQYELHGVQYEVWFDEATNEIHIDGFPVLSLEDQETLRNQYEADEMAPRTISDAYDLGAEGRHDEIISAAAIGGDFSPEQMADGEIVLDTRDLSDPPKGNNPVRRNGDENSDITLYTGD